MPAAEPGLLETGIPNLDLILGGGVPRGDVLLVAGPAGAGKTTLGLQMAFYVASKKQRALYISTLSEPPARLLRHVRPMAFYDEALVGKGLFLVSSYPLAKQGLEEIGAALIGAVKEHRAVLLILDGLMTIRDLHPGAPELRTFLYDLGANLATLDCTTVVLTSGGGDSASPELTMADGVLELGMEDNGGQTVRTVRVNKLRGLAPLLGRHSLRIDRAGITVFPRLESMYEPQDTGLSPERVGLGMPEMDRLIGGGAVRGSTTILAGALGTGKTLACLHFLMAGAAAGERGLFVGFRESPRQLIDKAGAFGLDLEGAVKDGRVTIVHRPPVDLVVDEVTWAIREYVASLAPRRIALDSIAELEQMLSEERRRRGYMAALLSLLRGKDGATSLVTKEVSQVIGPELDFSDTPLAVLVENLLLLRYVEFRGELFRVVSVLKMRDSDFDPAIRQYTIGANGLQVLDRLETAEGVLTGIARLPGELRVKRPREAQRRAPEH